MNCALAYELFAESIYMSRNLATIGACAIILLGSAAVSANAKAGGAGGASFGGHAGAQRSRRQRQRSRRQHQ